MDNDETYWGKPETEEEQRLVAEQQLQALYRIAGV
jgi:hypothetical protein